VATACRYQPVAAIEREVLETNLNVLARQSLTRSRISYVEGTKARLCLGSSFLRPKHVSIQTILDHKLHQM
jgi:hypothetical protein